MDTNQGPIVVPRAAGRKSRRIPLIWLVPIVTALIAGWLAWDTFSKRGPTITIDFEAAEGLQPGQSQLKFKDVTVGTVKAIAIAPDFTHVTVTVETTREAEPLLTDKALFWVVKPGIFAGRITGLDTLLSGTYIGMLPSTEKASSQTHFVGSADPPVLPTSGPGTIFMLETRRVGSVSLGSPVFYRDIEVGTVLGWDYGNMARDVTVHIFVRAPFDKFVHEDSVFWNASGISVKLGANGLQVQMESFRAVLLGGIAFEVNPRTKTAVAAANTSFRLYPNRDAARAAGFGRRLQMVSYFDGSAGGIEEGSEVTLHGLKIGEVTEVGLVYNPTLDRILVPVHYTVEAERIDGVAKLEEKSPVPVGRVAAEMVKRGFRATLQSASLISSQKVIAIEMVPDAPPEELGRDGEYFVVPTAPSGGLESITKSAAQLLANINRIDFKAIGGYLAGATKGIDDIVNGQQLKQSLAALQATMTDVQDVAHKLNAGASPALAKLPEISNQLDETLAHANKLVVSINEGYGNDSRFSREIDRLLPQINDMARSFRALADLLARHPEALIKGRTNTGKE